MATSAGMVGAGAQPFVQPPQTQSPQQVLAAPDAPPNAPQNIAGHWVNNGAGQDVYVTAAGSYGTRPAQNPNPATAASTTAAASAVQGIQSAAGGLPTGGGGEGSSYSVDPSGKTSYTVTPDLLPEKAKLNDATFNSRLTALTSAGGTPAPHVGDETGGALSPDEIMARNAAFARAKDQAGMTANSALEGLRAATSSRGLMGSTIEGEDMANIIGGGAGEINQYTDKQLASDLGRSAEVADRNYQGNVTQRGQDMQAKQALLALINSGSLY